MHKLKHMAGIVVLILLGLFILSVGPASADTGGKPVAEYMFNGDCKDASGNGNDGTVSGDVSFVDDSMFGKCALFNGGYITVKSSDGLNLGSKFNGFDMGQGQL